MIPVCEPLLGETEAQYVLDCLQNNWISSKGRYVSDFEKMFAEYCGCRYGISTTSGTTALHLALVALDIGPGDEVIVPAFTMAAPVFAIIHAGAVPVLVDAEPKTWNIDPTQIADRVTRRTKAVLPVHIYGHPCDMDPILAITRSHNIYVIEDAAEAHGAQYKGRPVGCLGKAACFSFYANKIITTGEGGMVVVDDEALARHLASLKDQALSPEQRFVHTQVGYNYRMTNVQAAIGLAQLERIDDLVGMRRRNARLYSERLEEVPGITLPVEKPWALNVFWMYSVLVDEEQFGMSRDELMEALGETGVETRPFFVPMHQQAPLLKRGLFNRERYPVAEELSQRGLYLPSSSGLTEAQIDFVCQAIRDLGRASVRRQR